MTLLWIGLLIVVAVVNKVIVNRLLQREHKYSHVSLQQYYHMCHYISIFID